MLKNMSFKTKQRNRLNFVSDNIVLNKVRYTMISLMHGLKSKRVTRLLN